MSICASRAAMKQHFGSDRSCRRAGPGLYDVTARRRGFVRGARSRDGLLTCFVQHTSASLLIQENADPDVLADLESFMRASGLARSSLYRHTTEGPDDMPAHIRSGADRGVAVDSRARGLRRCSAPGRGSICSSIATARIVRAIAMHVIGE